MNCVQLALEQVSRHPHRPAIWFPHASRGASVTFSELLHRAASMQHSLRGEGVAAGDRVLVLDRLGIRLYAAVLAVLGLGATVVLIEPWMPAGRVEQAAGAVGPKFLLGGWLGRLWGARFRAIRAIPRKLSMRNMEQESGGRTFAAEELPEQAPAIITFTSGTTGRPKGIARTHGALLRQHSALSRSLGSEEFSGPDLCVFANFVLSNAASGRTSLVLPNPWNPRILRRLDQLPGSLQPETLTCGPAFLQQLMRHAGLPGLRSVHVGGAPSDCDILERAFARWPDTQWTHLYGSTEAEPVAVADARKAVLRSRERGYFQTLYLGRPVPEIGYRLEPEGLWVRGPHVCGAWDGARAQAPPAAGRREGARPDERPWHFMGDRVRASGVDRGWWYRGRSGQPEADFALEQRIYGAMQTSSCFVERTPAGEVVLYGEISPGRSVAGVDRVVRVRIVRDRRHRARIDRRRSRGGGAWRPG